MPRPTADQLNHPKRLLFNDLKLQLWHAEHRSGKDRGTLLDMMDERKLVSCGQAAWPRAHVGFVTHGGDSMHADSYINCILVSWFQRGLRHVSAPVRRSRRSQPV